MTSAATHVNTKTILYWICRSVLLETVRRREISAVLLFMGLFIVGAVVARFVGAETDAGAAFIMNLGLSLSWFLSLIVAILLGARQFPDELEQRSIYPLLAKPVSRRQYIVGKWLAVSLAGCITALVLNFIALLASPWPEATSFALILQGYVLQCASLGAAVAIVMALSISIPKALAIAIAAIVVFAGTQLITIIQSLVATTSIRGIARWLTGYFPNFGKLDLVNAATAGMSAISAGDFLARVVYAALIIFLALAVAMALLERKPL